LSCVRCLLGAAIGVFTLAAGACSTGSRPATDLDAQVPDASGASEDASHDASRGDDEGAPADASQFEASVTEIILGAASFPIADGGVLDCGPDYDGVVVFYAATSDPMPTETGIVSCTLPVVIAPVEPNTAYQLDVYLQKGTTVVAQATCTATTRAGESVAPICPLFM
jgi:hypothetical protein